jgi:predicted permease
LSFCIQFHQKSRTYKEKNKNHQSKINRINFNYIQEKGNLMLTIEKRRLLIKLERWNFILSIFTLNLFTFILGNLLLSRIRRNVETTGTVILLFAYYGFIFIMAIIVVIVIPIMAYLDGETITYVGNSLIGGLFIFFPLVYWTLGIPAIAASKYLFVDEVKVDSTPDSKD